MSYIGSTPTTQSFIAGTDYFNGNGSTTAFTLSRPVVSVNDIQAVVNNVVQVPNDAYNVSGNTITFTSAPSSGTGNVYVRYLSTTTQSITPSQNTVSYATWDNDLRSETFAFKNRLINGDMNIDQRNNGAAVNLITAGGVGYCVDRWFAENTTSGTATIQRLADAPTGFSNSIRWTVTGTASTLASSDSAFFQQQIEGFNSADLSFGTANAQTVSVSFWVKSSVTGTFGGALANNAYNRAYSFSYTINSANTWEYKTITIPGDTTGTWVGATNGIGLRLSFAMAAGSARGSTAGSWGAFVGIGVSGQTNLMATNAATWQVTGVQLEKGTTATNFDVLPYGTELALCQRYFQYSRYYFEYAMGAVGNLSGPVVTFSQVMRASPTFTVLSSVGANNTVNGPTTISESGTGAYAYLIGYASSSTGYGYRNISYSLSAEL